jgi:hypothetical protein
VTLFGRPVREGAQADHQKQAATDQKDELSEPM